MNTETLVTIDHSALTAITGGKGKPLNACVGSSVIHTIFGGLAGGPLKDAVHGIAGCASALASHIPTGGNAGPSTYQRPGLPYATESRM
jgi:hypothetical protein